MAVAVAGLSVGILAALMLPVMPSSAVGLTLILAAAPALGWRHRVRGSGFIGAALLGAGLTVLEGGAALHDRAEATTPSRDVVLEGIVESADARAAGRISLVLSVPSTAKPVGVPGRVRLNWYDPPSTPAPGETWRLRVRLREPRGTANPGGFDYERWLLASRIGAVGYVRRDAANGRVHPADDWRSRARRHVQEAIEASAGREAAGTVLTALVVGQRAGLAPDTRDLLLRSGTAHLLAISGLHVGIAAASGALAGRLAWLLLWSVGSGLASRGSIGWRCGLSLASACTYAALAGLSTATQRALIMIATIIVMTIARRTTPAARGLLLAALLILLVDPLAPLDGGFWLSFVAVAILTARFAGEVAARSKATVLAAAQVALSVGMVVPAVMLFGFIAPVGPFVNLFAVPLVSIFVLPLALLGALASFVSAPAAHWLFASSALGIRILFEVVARLLDSVPAIIEAADSPVLVKSLAVLAGLALLLPRSVPGRGILPVLLLPVVFWGGDTLPYGEFELSVLDVGQGLSTVVRTRHHTLVYDTGASWNGGDSGASTVRPFLRHAGIRRIDLLMISHGDLDHAGGGASLAPLVEGPVLLGPGTAWPSGFSQTCREGRRWHWDGVDFRVLHPAVSSRFEGNNASCVLEIRAAGGGALLTGDIETVAERSIVARQWGRIGTDVMIAPHHGSTTSSGIHLVGATRPDWVVFAVGHRNRWGFPRDEVLTRWRSAGARPLRTSSSGAISFRFGRGSATVEPSEWRCTARRFWRAAECADQQTRHR